MHKSDRMVNNTRHVQAVCALRRATFKGQILGKFVFDVYIYMFLFHICVWTSFVDLVYTVFGIVFVHSSYIHGYLVANDI